MQFERRVKQTGKTCWVVYMGLIPYGPACEFQRQIVEARKARAIPDVLLLCEHPHVITLGRNGNREHLRAGNRMLAKMNVEFHSTDRGGDVTYHGPGQIVGYPILDLADHRRDVRWYVEQLEEVMIRASMDYGIAAKRALDHHGVWIDEHEGKAKLGALGVHLSRWVTSHGFAYNVSTDLQYFDLIVPCGIVGKRVTSLERTLGRAMPMDEARERLISHFAEIFTRDLVRVNREELAEAAEAARNSSRSAGSVMA